MSQDALITVQLPPMPKNALTEKTEAHISRLRTLGLLKPEHELMAALVLHLATIAGATTKGYAAAQVFRELREAIAALPTPTEFAGPVDDLAGELDALTEGDE